MLPTVNRGRASTGGYRNNSVLPQYLRRIVKYKQMDMEYTFWQMLHLCTSPKVVYQQTKYHKQTKNQWARDDPAFVVICSFLLAVAATAFCAAYGHSVAQATFTVVSVVFMHFFLVGVSLASICWLYAFDVHCNAYFPLYVVLYVLQYFLSPLLLAHGFVATLLSNTLYFVALSYYHYLNFLGYDVLPFLERTTFFLYPIGLLALLFPISLLTGFNPSRFALGLYFG
uniref:UNC-50-like protein n=1 Tax=Physcomitrium patens TaxID=3218 RepID=A0A7I4FE96_PHYPA